MRLLITMLLLLVLASGCAYFESNELSNDIGSSKDKATSDKTNYIDVSIGEINGDPNAYAGQWVSLEGTVRDAMESGSIIGFILEDNSGSTIPVSSTLLKESYFQIGEIVTVSGPIEIDALLGVYIGVGQVSFSEWD